MDLAREAILSKGPPPPLDPKLYMDWMRDLEQGKLKELDLEPIYASRRGDKHSDAGLPFDVLLYLSYYLANDTSLERLSLRFATLFLMELQSDGFATDLDLHSLPFQAV